MAEIRYLVPEHIRNEPDLMVAKRLYEAWKETDESNKYTDLFNEHMKAFEEAFSERVREFSLRQHRQFAGAVNADGTFRLEDIPAGEWTLHVELVNVEQSDLMLPDQCGMRQRLAHMRHSFTIPEIYGGQSDEPLYLGTLMLEKAAERMRLIGVGAEAPDFELKRLGVEAEEMVKLSDYRGKTVVVYFWATWCGACLGQILELMGFYERIKDNPDVVLLSISLDQTEEHTLHFLSTIEGMAWTQLHTAPDSPVVQAYGISAIPTMIVIGPDGNVIAVNPCLRELERLMGL
jgi:peroxiredoxin